MRVSQLFAVTVARTEFIDNLLFDARRRDAYIAVFGQVAGRCIHHALPLRTEPAPIVSVALSMICATFRALLMNSPGPPLLFVANDSRARIRAIPPQLLAAGTRAEPRPTSLALPFVAHHSARSRGRAENLVLRSDRWP